MTTEKPCSDHPDAPHGFVRNASHMAGHYVCECSGWTPPDPKSLQERLRDVLEQAAQIALRDSHMGGGRAHFGIETAELIRKMIGEIK